MRTRSELYAEARRRIAGRRQKAVTLAQQTREQALAGIPQLAGADAKIQRLGFESARLAASGAGHEAVEAAIQKRREAQQERDELLRRCGYNPQMLEPRYVCPLCRDTGTKDGKTCQCVIDLTRQMRREELLRGSALSLCSFDSMNMALYPTDIDPLSGMPMRDYMTRIIASLRRYAENFTKKSRSLILFGNAGLGKTHAALAIASTVLDRGYDVIYISAQDMCAQLERDRFEDDSTMMDAMLEADLLILDDLGTENLTSYTTSCLYTLINTRMAKQQPTIYTTNIPDDALLEKRYTEKIASRLSGSCVRVQFVGTDIRLSRHKK